MEPDEAALCQRLLAEGSRSFHAASRLLPGRLRLPAAAVYAFCRVADDAIDDAPPERVQDALDGLRRRLDRIYGPRVGDDPVDRAFSAVARQAAIPREVPEALLEGFAWDARGRRYDTVSDTRAYGLRVAGTVGLMMTCLMQPATDRWALSTIYARACDLGVAMQLTNIARDVGEDARMGRVYLPTEWLAEAGIDRDAWLADPRFSPALGQVVARLLAEADRLYRRADAGIAMLPWDCRPSITAARRIYADIGRVIARNGHDSVSQRAFTSTGRKVVLGLSSLVAMLPRDPPASIAEAPVLAECQALVARAAGAREAGARPAGARAAGARS
ncbi:MAG: phytoene/squalene synthase family protein [Alphaproteobacteria bacterium]|nr:phytoene/squalene synthase family protein [Alphaproteobacteria bacterium]